MEWLKQWLIGITAAAMLNAIAQSLMPKGAVRQVGRLTGGLVLLFAMLSPIYQLEDNSVAGAFAPYWADIARYEAAGGTDEDPFLKSIIEEQCSAYIQDKALQAGIECHAEVMCTSQTEGYPYPTKVRVTGSIDRKQRQWLEQLIETQLAIPKQAQSYETESGEIK